MVHFFLVFFVFIILVLILSYGVNIGRRFGQMQLEKTPDHKLEVISVAETSVFGLLGLLIAFTFSGAYDRFETRKVHMLEEVSAFSRAYEYIKLVPKQYQPELQKNVEEYLNLHIQAYNDIPDLDKVATDIEEANAVQERIWNLVVKAEEESSNKAMAQLYLPALSNMFEMADSGINMTRIHPPAIIFFLLIGLAALGAFLVGYNCAESKDKHPIHTLSYVLLTSFIIYLIINIEYPRVGFIRLKYFDSILLEVKENIAAHNKLSSYHKK